MKIQLLCFVLILCFIATLLPVMTIGAAADSPFSGPCGDRGDNLCWTFDDSTGTLTISGSGNMKSWYSSSDVPWSMYTSDITSLIIGPEVSSIGILAFQNCTGLTSVTIPDSVIYIESNAFHRCTGLTNVRIGDGVSSIGMSAFEGCTGLTSLTIPEGVTYIDFDAFKGCTGLASVTILGSITSIGPSAFADCTHLTLVTISGKVMGISMSAFSGCTGLSTVVIPDSVTIIDSGAFRSCSALSDVYYTGGEEMWNQIQINGENESLQNATIHFNHRPFTDVKGSDYFALPVLWAVGKGITNGTTANTFSPEAPCTRGQVVTFLWRAAGSPEPESTNNPFVDVKTTDFFYKPVLWAVENGITNGVDATHFGPAADCNRAQVVTFLYRAFSEQ